MDFYSFNPNRQPQTHPFWDFVADMDRRPPPSYGPRGPWGREQAAQAETSANENEKAQDKGKTQQPSVEDEHMTDAENPAQNEKRAHQEDNKPRDGERQEPASDDEPRWGRRCGGRRGWGRPHRSGFGPVPGPFGIPFFGPGSPFDDFEGPPGHAPHHHPHHHGRPQPPSAAPGEGLGFRGPPSPGPHDHQEGPRHGHGFRGRGGFGRRGGHGGRGRGREPFDLQNFLSDLSTRLGIDLNGAASRFGIDLSRLPGGNPRGDNDFAAPYDLFDLPTQYLVHVSLPGARREDIGLDFDSEHNTLRVAGVVHRPDVDEETNAALSHSGRNSQVGVFETKVRLAATEETVVNVDAISARLRDGILVVRVPKVEKKPDEKRTIRIGTPSPSPERQPSSSLPVREKQATIEEPETEMYEDSPAPSSETEKGDQHRNEKEELMREDPAEVLPTYTPVAENSHDQPRHPEEDDEDDEEREEEEGEYVKITVD